MKLNSKIISATIQNELSWNIKDFEDEIQKLDKLSWSKYKMIDSHIHIVDFNQKTSWLKDLLKYMDKSNVMAWVVFWMPVVKIWSQNEKYKPEYYLDDDNPCYYYSNTDSILANEYLSLSNNDKKRFFPLICWFNPLDINCVDHIIQTYKMYPWVFYWIGEVFYRHDDLTHMTYWEVPTMNTQATSKLMEFITEYDLPLLIHNNITAPWISDYPKFLHEMEVMLREFPKARVILAHAGASRRLKAPYYTKMLKRLLNEYEHLYLDYSWVIFDEFIAINDTTMQDWIYFTNEFSDRIMIWSDVLWNAFSQIWIINSRFNSFLDKLTQETRDKVCFSNAIKIYSKSKNKVEKNKKITYPNLFNN